MLAIGMLVAIAAPASAVASEGATPEREPRERSGKVADCKHVDRQPHTISVRTAARTVVCLVNRERQSRGLRKLRRHWQLNRSARSHSRQMKVKSFFAHRAKGGPRLSQRIRRTGYMRKTRSWFVAENLAWGAEHRGSPGAIVAAWMKSPGHRRNILSRRPRELGVGAVRGVPRRAFSSYARRSMIITANFGSRR